MKYIITEEQKGNIKDFLIDKIEDGELIQAAKLVGGYSTLLTLLGDYKMKPEIKQFLIRKYVEDSGRENFQMDLDNQIVLIKDGDTIHRIYSLSSRRAAVVIYNNKKYINDYSVPYSDLSDSVLDKIIAKLSSL